MNVRRAFLGSLGAAAACASVLATPRAARADATTIAPAAPAAPAAPVVSVHIESPVLVHLERYARASSAWEPACDSPCDQALPLDDEYRLVDPKGKPSDEPIRLRAEPGGEVTLTYAPASTAEKVGGGALVAVGAVIGGLGTVSLLGGIVLAATPSHCGPDSSMWCGSGSAIGGVLVVVGAVGMLAGAGIIVGGVSLVRDATPSTKQRLTEQGAFVREPAWVAPRVGSGASPRPAMVVPLGFSF